MQMNSASVHAPISPRVRLCVGITGHREDNPAFAAQRTRIDIVLEQVLDLIAAAADSAATGSNAAVRLHSLLADGADQLAAQSALRRGWELSAPLPFGLALNVAINAHPTSAAEVRALLRGDLTACAPAVRERATRIRQLASQARLFELAERDELIGHQFLAKLEAPDNARTAATYNAEISLRASLAGRVMIEQCDLVIGIWDGATRALIGGTGHTIQLALDTGAPVLWIDANNPEQWCILHGPEALVALASAADTGDRGAALQLLVRQALLPAPGRQHPHHSQHRSHAGAEGLAHEHLQPHSERRWHLYRRVEALFGADNWRARFRGLRQTYETPDTIVAGSAAPVIAHARALLGQPPVFVDAIERDILRRFAWADGVSAFLSDQYRGGMVANFLLAPLAIIGGIAYLPFASSHEKWIFALFELALLLVILAITGIGQRRRWHGRWFETRRVAEYLRHGPILLLLGVARAPGRWLQGTETSWPEWYARHALREVGLPSVAITQRYLREAVTHLLHPHVQGQRDYHLYKARRLANAHHNLDRLSEVLFVLAVISVAGYLLLKGGGLLHLWPLEWSERSSYFFTFLGVLLPTFGGAIAGIRYFGDFERFSAISSITAEQLSAIDQRIQQLCAAPDGAIDYGTVAELAHATDEVVVNEIENWQSVFGGKHVSVPV
ncbi:MAG TPA: hypothetical protein VMH83_10665 [Candidatus Acidoferrum sp.]|nr:hypothetical protein [Candidatus Acidoferrum sp.]